MTQRLTRRSFLYWLPWLFPASVVIYAAVKDSRVETFNSQITYGYINARDGDGANYKAYLNGEDVSGQTFEADDREGFVGIYEADIKGNIVSPLRSRRIYGKVRIVPIE